LRHRWVIGLVLVLLAFSTFVVSTNSWNGKPWHLKRGLDLAGGVRVVLQAETEKLPEGQEWSPYEHLGSIIRIMRSRVDIMGVSEPLIQPKGKDQVVIELPDIKNKDEAIKQLKSTARMEFRHLYNVHSAGSRGYRPAAARYTMESGAEGGKDVFTFMDAEGNPVDSAKVIAESRLILTGNDLNPVSSVTKDDRNFPAVALEFTREGKKKFADFTRRNVKEILAIILDNEILSAPSISEPILDGRAIITGRFQPREAQRLADFINAGALPVPLKVVQIQSVEATLGMASVTQSVRAGVWGLAAIVVFMILYYLLPGLVADVALGIYALLTLAGFKLFGVTMTLPGIAAYILSIGMAVDANILIFERLKEELRSGKTLRASIDAGFSRAFTSIFDSNMCTLITCVILRWLGTGPIRGFALVLGMGVLISMFTAITVTRNILHLIVNTRFGESAALFGLGRQWVTGRSDRQVDIVGRMKVWFALSAIVLIPGLYYWLGAHGLKAGIDFTGGSLMQVEFKQPVQTAAIDGVLANGGFPGSLIQRSADNTNTVFIRTKDISEEKFAGVQASMKSLGGTIQASERVGPTVSRELTMNAIKAVLFAALGIVLYLSVRFAIGGLAYGFRFGVCAVLATLHDVCLIIGVFAMLGYFLNWEIDSLFVTAVLTIIGFSTHDTIVIFDRIRENLRHRAKGETFAGVANRSILQSFARSINTSLTVILTLVALLVFGAENIRHFVVALLIGVVTGTYSSIFNASQLLVLWQGLVEKQPSGFRVEPAASRAAQVRDLKPLAAGDVGPDSGSGIEGEAEGSVAPKPVGGKAKAKRRKRRF